MLFIFKSIPKLKRYFAFLIFICLCMVGTAILTADALAGVTAAFSISGLHGTGILISATIILFLLDTLACYTFKFICGRIQSEAYTALQRISFDKILHLPNDSKLLAGQGDLYSRLTKDSSEISEFFSVTAPKIFLQTAQICLITAYMFATSWQLSSVYFIVLILSVTLQILFTSALKRISQKRKACEVRLNTCLKDIVSQRLVTKTYDAAVFSETICSEAGKEYAHADVAMQLRAAPIQMAGLLCGMLPTLSLCMAAIIFIPKGMITFSSFMSLFYLCQRILPDQLHYVDLFFNAVRAMPAYKRIRELWQTTKAADVRKISKDGSICLENIYYRYPDSDKLTVENISLNISSGKKVAFIGKSGCGKSTVLKIIDGLLAPESGTISTPKTVLSCQFPNLFDGTVSENIAGFQKPDKARLARAYNAALLTSFLPSNDDGLSAHIDSHAKTFSGGQLQRIALARALYTNAPVLLLDESISALDAATAKSTVTNIFEAYASSTIVMVLHQLEFLPLMDEIYLFEDGKIVFRGTYQQLSRQIDLKGALS